MKILKRSVASVAAVFTALFVMASVAYATPGPLDGVATEVEAGKDDLLDFVTGTALPVLFAVLLVGIGIRLGVKYLRRAGSAA